MLNSQIKTLFPSGKVAAISSLMIVVCTFVFDTKAQRVAPRQLGVQSRHLEDRV
jgi:hypothetical protein